MEQPAYITAEPSSGGSRVDIGLDVQGDGGGRGGAGELKGGGERKRECVGCVLVSETAWRVLRKMRNQTPH